MSLCFLFFSSRRRHTRFDCDWSSDVCSSDLHASEYPYIKWPNGEYREVNTDLQVKVLGGSIDIARTWTLGRWWLNPAWAPLDFELDPLGRDAKTIQRAGTLYERSRSEERRVGKECRSRW